MGMAKRMEKNSLGVRKGSWTREEDVLLKKCIENYGEGKWHLVPIRAGLNRCRKSCRLRWLNYLRPNIKRGFFSKDEVDLIKRLHKLLGNRWSLIAGRLPGRTANDVKNFWNTHIDKKFGSGGTATTAAAAAAAASPRNSRERDKGQQIKTITESNILRPQPRTFSKPLLVHHHVVPHQPPRPNPSCKINEKPNNNNSKQQQQQQCSPARPPLSSSSLLSSLQQEDVDECIKWWSNLLDATELGELGGLTSPPPTFFDDNQQLPDDHQLGSLLSHEHEGGRSDTPENGSGSWMKTSSMHLDVDGWGLVNRIHDQPFMPFN